ncbi:MAG: ABC transporter ATP-binding protein [Bdellovibrionales bacterium]|nr:ABC transporter ATP-binding protein [Bdellovibrionales bacterium]
MSCVQPLLEIRDLRKIYPAPRGKAGVVRAVDGVSFSVRSGECFGLLGPNGAGKSTTLEIAEGILSATSGEVLYKGAARGPGFREEVGVQFQNTELPLYLSVRETLEFFSNLFTRRMPLAELIALCRLDDILERDNRKISGGQKQRLLLAMALVNDPDLVFLDEPTTGLDPQARRHLWDIVQRVRARGKTVILTTHYMEEAQILCDRLVIMDHGKIIAEGTPRELLDKHCAGASVVLPGATGAAALSGLPWKAFDTGEGVEVLTEDVSATVRALLERGFDLSRMSVRSRNLEDLFLLLTGKDLRA